MEEKLSSTILGSSDWSNNQIETRHINKRSLTKFTYIHKYAHPTYMRSSETKWENEVGVVF